MKTQVKKEHYDFNKYVNLGRRESYYHQIKEVCKCKWNSVLLIGIWDWITVDILKRIGKKVTTFDFDKSLNPDIVWDITNIDNVITNKKYDIVLCCQVLEHIPFSFFEPTIKKLSKISHEKLILSLPNRNIWFKLRIYIPIIGNIINKFNFRIFWKNSRDFNKDWLWEHYREIDVTKEYKQKNILNILKKYFQVESCFIPFNMQAHTFFILCPITQK